jgi:hypothetical protein
LHTPRSCQAASTSLYRAAIQSGYSHFGKPLTKMG